MNLSSPKIEFDKRLLAVEELFRQRQYQAALEEFRELDNVDFTAKDYEHGLYLSLAADAEYFLSNYKKSIEYGLKSARLLADYNG